ncbi:hypothetical protein Vadar_025258 [Vaccinium darrowii]|uniref:Uncharacterized protein n=1 Tax=Vaccinium darrowii TaxID=229202 RepID=A0ACB7Y2V1_9ERIC|nr:hypothetical protein Vadar_025258 [Vaccinium darrowii]
MSPGTKKKGSSTQVLRKSQRIQEGGGSPNGSTSALPTECTVNVVEGMPVIVAQPSELPTSPLNETNQLFSPCNVVAGVGSTSIPSKKRGPTRGINVDKLRKKLGHPIPIEIDREIMAIVGDHATVVANALGESIRAHAPVRDIGCKVEFGIRESIILRVGQTFELGDYKNDKVLRRLVDVKCQSLYANWKTKLFKRYKKLKKKHEKKRRADPKTLPLYPCNPDDWVFMIDNVWRTDDWKKKSKRGKKAQKVLKYNHTSGSQSFVARASMHVKEGKKSKQSFPERFKEMHIRHRMGTDVWIDDKAKKHHDEIVKMIDEQKQPDVTNPLSEEQNSVESQGVPNSEVVALKQQVADQEQLLANQGKVLADYGKKLEKMMLMLATGVDPAAILGLIQSSENGESTLVGQQNGTPTS